MARDAKSRVPGGRAAAPYPAISDDAIRETIEANQLGLLRERGADITIFSPRASTMGRHIGDEAVSIRWARLSNDLITRVCALYADTFAAVCMLPQSAGADLTGSIAEQERCVGDLGCNRNPDPGGGYFTAPPLTARHWHPFYDSTPS